MFPLRDHLPRAHPPVATASIVALNVASWALLQGFGSEAPLVASVCRFGLIPGELLGGLPDGSAVPLGPYACPVHHDGAWLTALTSMFMHGGWFHIIGNMWFLWVFGDNVEDVMGRARYVLFYLLCGLAAAGAQTAVNPGSAVPMVGASGAIGGVMGAYVMLHPMVRVETLLFLGFYVTTIAVPAWFMLGYWFLLQVLGGLPTLSGVDGGGTAFWAHVGGFAAGAVLVHVFREPAREARARAAARRRWW